LTFSYDKPRVLAEAARVLKKGAYLLICEPVLVKGTSQAARKKLMENLECLENGVGADEYKAAIKRAGFKKAKVIDETEFPVSRMMKDKRAQARLAQGEITAADIEAMSGLAISVKIKATR
jgi:ubiquinone/menaquinone biosynthesis C-methylase UbiE